ncbi:hypothetical protein D1872_291050 [compost metagenome]
MHVLTADIRLLRIIVQVFLNVRYLGIHTALHVTAGIVVPIVEYAFIMHQTTWIGCTKIIRYIQDNLTSVGFITAGPDQDGRMILVALYHGDSPIHNNVLPFWEIAWNVPGRLYCA